MNVNRRAILAGIGALATTPALARSHLRTLFIGNSFTLQNDVPGLVRDLAAQAGTELEITTLARNGAYLADHAPDRQAALDIVHAHTPDILVLQDHSTAALTETKRQASIPAHIGFSYVQGRLIHFAPWPRAPGHGLYQRAGMPMSASKMVKRTEDHLARVMSIGDAHSRSHKSLAPVGRAWLLGQGLALHAADGYHASIIGSWFSALVLARAIGLAPETPVAPDGVIVPERLNQFARLVVP